MRVHHAQAEDERDEMSNALLQNDEECVDTNSTSHEMPARISHDNTVLGQVFGGDSFSVG